MKISDFALFSALAFLLPVAGQAEDFEEPKDIAPLNRAIATAASKGEEWLQDPSVIAGMLTDPWLSNDPDRGPGSQSREIVATSEGNAGANGKVTVIVKEVGLFDDAVRRIDHTYEFALKDGTWAVTGARLKAHDARPPFPAKNEDPKTRRAGILLCWSSTGFELEEQAKANGIEDLPGLVSEALGGDREALEKVLKFGAIADGAAAEIYAELAFGLSCVFEPNTFQRFLYFNLEENERKAVQEYIEWIASDVVPE